MQNLKRLLIIGEILFIFGQIQNFQPHQKLLKMQQENTDTARGV